MNIILFDTLSCLHLCVQYRRKDSDDKGDDDKKCPNLYVRLCHIVLRVYYHLLVSYSIHEKHRGRYSQDPVNHQISYLIHCFMVSVRRGEEITKNIPWRDYTPYYTLLSTTTKTYPRKN